MIDEDLDSFVDDFGVSAKWGSQYCAKAILSMPDQVLGGGGEVITTAYKLRFVSAAFPGLKYGETITVDGDSYKVNEVRKVDDGKFSEAILSKI